MINLRPFQDTFIKKALFPGINTACLSLPRGNGKTTLSAMLTLKTLIPGDKMFVKGSQNHMVAASVGQARRTCFGVLRRMVEDLPTYGTEYLVSENPNLCRVLHKPTGTEVTVLPASGRAAMGLLNARWIVADEPASWKPTDGGVMHEASTGSTREAGRPSLRVLYVGTLAPAGVGHWWPELVHAWLPRGHPRDALPGRQGERGTSGRQSQNAIRLCGSFTNPGKCSWTNGTRRAGTPALRARFLSYRLNCPAEDSSRVLLTTHDWGRAMARDVAPRFGQPVVGLDLGAGRAWSAAVGVWPTGRAQAVAVCPGVPSVQDQEHRDRVPPGLYARLIDDGSLIVAHGLRVPPASASDGSGEGLDTVRDSV